MRIWTYDDRNSHMWICSCDCESMSQQVMDSATNSSNFQRITAFCQLQPNEPNVPDWKGGLNFVSGVNPQFDSISKTVSTVRHLRLMAASFFVCHSLIFKPNWFLRFRNLCPGWQFCSRLPNLPLVSSLILSTWCLTCRQDTQQSRAGGSRRGVVRSIPGRRGSWMFGSSYNFWRYDPLSVMRVRTSGCVDGSRTIETLNDAPLTPMIWEIFSVSQKCQNKRVIFRPTSADLQVIGRWLCMRAVIYKVSRCLEKSRVVDGNPTVNHAYTVLCLDFDEVFHSELRVCQCLCDFISPGVNYVPFYCFGFGFKKSFNCLSCFSLSEIRNPSISHIPNCDNTVIILPILKQLSCLAKPTNAEVHFIYWWTNPRFFNCLKLNTPHFGALLCFKV